MERTAFDAARDFALKNGQLVGDERQPRSLDQRTTLLRQRLLLEELGEVAQAVHEGNLVDIADGLCDLLYVTMGAAAAVGLALEDSWPMMTARLPAAAPEDGGQPAHLAQLAGVVVEIVAILNERFNEVWYRTRFAACVKHVAYVAYDFNIDLRRCYLEVHRSNLSKRLGGASDGLKYGNGNPKGAGYTPPDLAPILGLTAEGSRA
jgi:NTP pyrophosphatase (non-canonical NTP hydrolase)